MFGVEFIALFNLILNIIFISIASSVHDIQMMGMTFSANLQVLNAAWALLGIPIIISAGVGAVYRIESHLRIYFYYLTISFLIEAMMLISFLSAGDICKTAVPDEVQQMGQSFVCGLTDSFVYFWLFIGGVVNLYFMYVVWSSAEDIHRSSYPELLSYREKLQTQASFKPGAKMPIASMPTLTSSPQPQMPIASSQPQMPIASGNFSGGAQMPIASSNLGGGIPVAQGVPFDDQQHVASYGSFQ